MLPSFQRHAGPVDSKVFELHPISSTTFRKKPPTARTHASTSSSSTGSRSHTPGQGQPASSARPQTGSVSCFVPFQTRDQPDREYVAVGTEEGVWIGLKARDDSFQRVMAMKDVRQMDCVAEADQLLILADNVLFAYPISSLLAPSHERPLPSLPRDLHRPASTSDLRPSQRASSSSSIAARARARSPGAPRRPAPQRLSGQGKVHFFSAGVSQGRTLVIYGKRKGINECIFRCLEWVPSEKELAGKWKVYKDFFIPSDTYFLKFLRSKIAIGCSKGVEILDLSTLQGGTIPVLPSVTPAVAALASLGLNNHTSSSNGSHTQTEVTLAKLAKRCEGAIPLGIGRVEQGPREGEFLLVYETFGLYLSPHGGHPTPPLTPLLTWTTHATSCSFQPPNQLVLLSANFIEIRNTATGEVSQMLSGNNIRKCWEERGVGVVEEELPAYGAREEEGEGGGREVKRRGRLGVVMDGDGEEGEQILHDLVPVLPDLPLSPLTPPRRPVRPLPPSPPIAFGGRTESFAAPASLQLPPLDLGTMGDEMDDYFRAG